MSSPKSTKRSRPNSDREIPTPTPHTLPSSIRSGSGTRVRGEEKRRARELELAQIRAKHFVEFAQVIEVPTTLAKLKADSAKANKEDLELICNTVLGPNQPAQCISAKFVAEDGETLLLYFGRRIVQKGRKPPVCLYFITYTVDLI